MRVAQQLRHERVGVDDFAGVGVEDEDAVLGGLEEPPIAHFGSLHGDFRLLAFGDVLNGEQDQFRLAVHRLEAAGVEQHDLLADRREVVFHVEVVDGMAVRQDFLQQRPQARNVPLAVAQVVDEAAFRFLLLGVERLVEGPVRRLDAEALVEDDERLSQGRDDVLGVGEGVLHVLLLPPAFGDVSEHQHDPGDFAFVVANRGGTVVNGPFRAVLGDEQAVVRQPDDHALPQGSHRGTLDRLAALFVDDAEHAVERSARRLLQHPAGQGLRDRVEEGDAALGVRGNHRIANAGERDTTPLRLEVQRFLACR